MVPEVPGESSFSSYRRESVCLAGQERMWTGQRLGIQGSAGHFPFFDSVSSSAFSPLKTASSLTNTCLWSQGGLGGRLWPDQFKSISPSGKLLKPHGLVALSHPSHPCGHRQQVNITNKVGLPECSTSKSNMFISCHCSHAVFCIILSIIKKPTESLYHFKLHNTDAISLHSGESKMSLFQ